MWHRLRTSASGRDLQWLAETFGVVVVTWLLLGWTFDRAISQADATIQWVPYHRIVLDAGFDWTDHLYRFGVIGGAPLHDSAGTLPIVQLCAALGMSATNTANAITVVVQLCFGFFGLKAIDALVAVWTNHTRSLTAPERITAVWACSFAPVLGWRLAMGHENLLLGLLPLIVALALVLAARARTASVVTLVFGAFASFTGLSGLGPQMIVYSIVFAGPVVLAAIADAPRGDRWGRSQWIVVAALAAGALVTLPRFAGMVAHATGDDFARGDVSLFASFGTASARDWLESVPWSNLGDADHEHNFPVGPLVLFLILAWPHAQRRLRWVFLASALFAMLFGSDTPVSAALLAIVPPLEAFRVPARAVLPILVCVPVFALAGWWATTPPPRPGSRVPWLYLTIAAAVIVFARPLASAIREPLVWLGCGSLAAIARWRTGGFEQRQLGGILAITLALGVVAFDERFPRDVPYDRIEDGPRAVGEAVLAAAPELRMPLERIQIPNAPLPYSMSTAFAAGLPSLDGAWYPTRRFLELLGALTGKPLEPTTGVFQLTRSRSFPILQQLYNVKYQLDVKTGSIARYPEPPGPAWFVARIAISDTASEIARTWWDHRADLRTELAATAWMLRGELSGGPPPASPACASAKVLEVTTDARGQTATIAVDTPADCMLVVATNYVRAFAATATVDGAERAVEVVPVNVALTGIAVPRGARRITLAPQPRIPGWTRVASLVGLLLLGFAVVMTIRSPVERGPGAGA